MLSVNAPTFTLDLQKCSKIGQIRPKSSDFGTLKQKKADFPKLGYLKVVFEKKQASTYTEYDMLSLVAGTSFEDQHPRCNIET